MNDDLEQIIADQMDRMGAMSAEIVALREGLGQARAKLHSYQRDGVGEPVEGDDPYWTGVYNNIRAAWDKWALAELGTASPSPLDLQGRPELAALWEAVR